MLKCITAKMAGDRPIQWKLVVTHTHQVVKLATPPALNHLTYTPLDSTFPAHYSLLGTPGMRGLAAMGSLWFKNSTSSPCIRSSITRKLRLNQPFRKSTYGI